MIIVGKAKCIADEGSKGVGRFQIHLCQRIASVLKGAVLEVLNPNTHRSLCSPPPASPTPVLPTRAQWQLQTVEVTFSPKETPSRSANIYPECHLSWASAKHMTKQIQKAPHQRKRTSTKLLRRRAAKEDVAFFSLFSYK